jgi:flavin reductase (DIM6/NTAB) family NADH-FMN oxidoreductase RutF
MIHYTQKDFAAWERFYRANLLNSLSGFKATHLVATLNTAGLPNLSLFHNVVHLGADPALIGMVSRPRAASPHTIANIEATQQWSLNSVHIEILEQAHQCSAKYPDDINEFEAAGLTAEWKDDCTVPLVKESALQYVLSLVEIIPITHNQTYFIIGKIERVWIREDLLSKDGFLTLEKAGIITSTGLDAYYTAAPLARYKYAKPEVPVQKL